MEISGNDLSVNLKSCIKNIFTKTDKKPEQQEKHRIVEDKVDLSFRAKEIQSAKAHLNDIPEIRNEKVTMIKERIERGIYQIDGGNIALKMLKESIENDGLTRLDIRA